MERVALNDIDDDYTPCPQCGSDDREWETCWHCHGECGFDLHDEDPINYSPGEETETCDECRGEGGYLVCHGCIAKAKLAPQPTETK